ncbi:MAG: methyltransferase type 12 [Agrobacterium sp. SCN 61-19]|nr:MAG: methyltransferase type 12 [Agrobacterium sp. SCN 61-19]
MGKASSRRLMEIADALPLSPGMRVLEIGCGPGVLARLIVERMQGEVFVLGIDRSAKAIVVAKAKIQYAAYPTALAFREAEAEGFQLAENEAPYDLAVAVRVGALDGRHPEAGRMALRRLRAALTSQARLFIDGGDPLREIPLTGLTD